MDLEASSGNWDGFPSLSACLRRSISNSETHLESWVWFWAPQQGCMDILGTGQRRAMEAVKALKHLTYKEKLRELSLCSVEKKKLKGILTLCINTSWEALRMMGFFSGAQGQDRQ